MYKIAALVALMVHFVSFAAMADGSFVTGVLRVDDEIIVLESLNDSGVPTRTYLTPGRHAFKLMQLKDKAVRVELEQVSKLGPRDQKAVLLQIFPAQAALGWEND